jgi:heptosyltransferase III
LPRRERYSLHANFRFYRCGSRRLRGAAAARLMDIQSLRRRIARRGMRLLAGAADQGGANAVLSPRGVFRILICRNSHSLGNNLLLTPLLQEIEALWPGAEVDIVTRNPIAPELFSGYHCVGEVICLPRKGLRHPFALLRGLRRVQRNRYDLAIDTDPRSQTGRALLLRSQARFKLGFAGVGKSGAISCAVDPAGAPRHNGHYPVHLLRVALQRDTAVGWPLLDLRLSAAEKQAGAEVLRRVAAQSTTAKPRGVIGIFANATGGKLLSVDWWRAFMPAIDEHFKDFALVEIVPVSGVSLLEARYPFYYSSGVRKLAATLSQLSLLICLDGGVMHLARAAGTPVIGVFTHTDTAEWGPYGEGAAVVDAREMNPAQTAQAVIRVFDSEPLLALPAADSSTSP